VTVQTAAQVAEVRTLMRKAGVSPQASIAGPGSAVLRDIAGPTARPAIRAAAAAAVRRASAPVPITGQPGSRGAAAASSSFRGRRGRR
jgi:hypothetical protein